MSWLTPSNETKDTLLNIFDTMGRVQGHSAEAAGVYNAGHAFLNPSAPALVEGPPPPEAPVPGPAEVAAQLAAQERLRALQDGSGSPAHPVDDSIRSDEEARGLAATQDLVLSKEGRDAARQQALAAQMRGTEAGIDIAAVEQNVERQKADLLGAANEQASRDTSAFRADQAVLEKHANDMQKKYDMLASDAAHAEMKDFWADKSTGSRIMGIIAQTLSGAANGLAGQPGAPSALDRIIDRDFELQKRNLSHKVESAQTAQGALSQIYNSISNKQQAFNTMQMAMNNKVKSEIAEMDTLFKSDTASARARQGQAQMDQKNAELQAQNRQLDVQQNTQELNQVQSNRTQMRNQDVQANLFKDKQGGGVEVPGLNGSYDKVLARQFITKNADLGAGVSQVNGLEALFNKGGDQLDAYRKSEVGNTFLKGLNRGILGTGANLSPEESKDLQSTVLNFLKGRTIETLGVQERHQLFSNVRLAYGRIFRGRALATFGGATLNREHPLWGSTFKELDDEESAGAPAQ